MLPRSETVDAVFARLLARYGNVWVAKWNGVPMDAVKMDWAQALDGISREAILYALWFLPLEFPPTSTQFRAICARAPERGPAVLPAPESDPQRSAEALEAVRQAAWTLAQQHRIDPKGWAHRLKARDVPGAGITITQRAMYRAALGTDETGAA